MERKFFIGIMAIIFCLPTIVAQTSQITENVNKDIEKRCKETVDAYTYHVGRIVDKNNSDLVKEESIETALFYFIGEGDGLKLLDEWGNPVMEDGAFVFKINPPRIEITSRYRETQKPYIKTYLRSLLTLPYEEVSISSSNAHILSELKQVGENEYEAVLGYAQIFKGRNGEWTIIDIDKKWTRMRISREIYDDGKERWNIKMGDIYAQSIEHK